MRRSRSAPPTQIFDYWRDPFGNKLEPPGPPPDSWAASPDSDVAIWTVQLDPGAHWTLPPARNRQSRRHLYFFAGDSVHVGARQIDAHAAIELLSDALVELVNRGTAPAKFLLLQGRPIGEPVVQHGPFVMNSELEVRQAFVDYERTQFGGWPWPEGEPVHGPRAVRFARFADGRTISPP